jgi:monoamine oxidase
MTFIVGKAADIWASPGKSFEERREAIVNQLVAVFGPKARTELIDGDYYVEKDWSGTVSGGCPTGVLPPNVFGQHGAALRRPIGNMHFAGSESATAWAGYMNGAIQSGIRAASEVFLALQ